MPRYAMKIAYDGHKFSGFQYQDHVPSIQAALEKVLSHLNKAPVRLVAAGRTDAGVHARGQVVSFDLEKAWDPYRLFEACNYHLKPNLIVVLAVSEVDAEFSARFSARGRRYCYKILTRHAPAIFQKGRVWQNRRKLEIAPMQEAACFLIGTHDFTTFRSSLCQAHSPIKTLDRLDIEMIDGPEGFEVHFHLAARSFLHNQVRSIVGTLECVGRNKWLPLRVQTALEARDRAQCGPMAPAQGLYLEAVSYDMDLFGSGYQEV